LSGELNDVELAGAVFLLFGAGHHTTATMFALSTFFLLSQRDRWEAARANLSSIARTVEELLRYLNPINTPVPRTATADVELNGVVIKAGETVAVCTAQPSGDLDNFPDLNRFDQSREPTPHLAFGYGRHMCLGQHLARLELQVGLEGLMLRFPKLHLSAPIDEVRLEPSNAIRQELRVAW
jgi:cytochrome P450